MLGVVGMQPWRRCSVAPRARCPSSLPGTRASAGGLRMCSATWRIAQGHSRTCGRFIATRRLARSGPGFIPARAGVVCAGRSGLLCKRTKVVPNGQNYCVFENGQNYCVLASGSIDCIVILIRRSSSLRHRLEMLLLWFGVSFLRPFAVSALVTASLAALPLAPGSRGALASVVVAARSTAA